MELVDYLKMHYRTGWNDVQYGTVCSPRYTKESVETWVRRVMDDAIQCWKDVYNSFDPCLNRLAYYGGTILCCEKFLKDGKVDRI